MIRTPHLTALAAMVFLAAGVAHAASAPGDLGGLWRTAEGDGLVAFRSCGDALCGYLVDDAKPESGARSLLIDRLMRAREGWSGGRILDPQSGRAYAGAVRVIDPGRIRVTGCLVGPLCGSQVWKRER